MIKKTAVFTAVKIALVVVAVGIIGWLGYNMVQNNNKLATVKPTPQSQAVPVIGTSASIDSLTTQDANSETAIDSSHMNQDQTNTQATTTAAGNIGGAYDESNF